MLEPWARRRARVKKWIAWQLFESANLGAARAFHATSAEEAESIRACGVRAPIAVIPNGVAAQAPVADAPPVRGRYVLFMSRLHPKKGLEMLLDAWSAVRGAHPDVRLVISGPDLIDYRPTLERKARTLALGESTLFHDPLHGEAKSSALAKAEVFVLPSFSENFGIVVAEALSHGTPVITTRATPWASLEENRCGWWIDPTVDALTSALSTALALSPDERRAYGDRGRALVRDSCSWDAIAADTAAFYRWICEDNCRPSLAPTFLAG
jgi:glycosyltransferase involved in cell wall biosynthesis